MICLSLLPQVRSWPISLVQRTSGCRSSWRDCRLLGGSQKVRTTLLWHIFRMLQRKDFQVWKLKHFVGEDSWTKHQAGQGGNPSLEHSCRLHRRQKLVWTKTLNLPKQPLSIKGWTQPWRRHSRTHQLEAAGSKIQNTDDFVWRPPWRLLHWQGHFLSDLGPELRTIF